MASTYVRLPAGGVDNLMLCCDSYKVRFHVASRSNFNFEHVLFPYESESDYRL